MPLSDIELRIRDGKAIFKWRQLRSWIDPALSGALSEDDDNEVELPLSEIVPSFMARRKTPLTKIRPAVPSGIPDLFSGKRMGSTAEKLSLSQSQQNANSSATSNRRDLDSGAAEPIG